VTTLTRGYARLLQWLGHARWFALTTKHVLSKLDRALYRASGGRLTASGPALPTLLLTTVGRKTGRPRTVPVYYLRDGDNLVVASENFGLPTRSSWPQNLRANPLARVQVGRRVRWYRARQATAAEVERFWPRFLEIWPAMETYYKRTGERWVFVLVPTQERDDRLGAEG
jgi:deazaflavin-dependent oxidoreductase (nitroreductase family)